MTTATWIDGTGDWTTAGDWSTGSVPGAGDDRALAACYAQMGRLDDARQIVERLRAIISVVIPDVSFLRNAEQRELYLSGLRLAIGETVT